ncbi:MAG: NIPSNAP family protein [Mucilaginibacter sp.]
MTKGIKFFNALVLICLLSMAAMANATGAPMYYYQIKIYHLKTKMQEDRLDSYLKNAYLPALHRASIAKVGVFKSMDQDTSEKKVYVLIPYSKLGEVEIVDNKLQNDAQYLSDGKDYIDATYNDLPYTRVETIVLKAFPKWPAPTEPQLTANKADRVYELRSYESPTEKLNINKVRMFNDGGETVLFNRLNFNAVFYAEVLAGSHMPNLMYMTTFNSKADRDKHWDTFSNDPEWKTLVAKPEYQHNVSKADIIFLHPAEYSDF